MKSIVIGALALFCLDVSAAALVARWNGFTGLSAESELAPDKGFAKEDETWKMQLNGGTVNADGSLSTGTGVAPRIVFNGTQYQSGGTGLGGFTVVMEALPSANFTAGRPLWEWFANDNVNSIGVILTSASGIRGDWAKALWNNNSFPETAVTFPATGADSSIVATICDGNGMKVIWDGAQVVNCGNLKGSSMGNGNSFYCFGNFAAATSGGNDYAIRRLAIWNGSLSAAEIAADPFGDLVLSGEIEVPAEGRELTTISLNSRDSLVFQGATPGTLSLSTVPSFHAESKIVIEGAANLPAGVYPLVTWTTPTVMSMGYGRPRLDKSAFANPERVELVYLAKSVVLQVKSAEQMQRPNLVIMPLGDSITEGYCPNNSGANYRVQLMSKLSLAGYNPVSVGEWSGNKNKTYTRDPSGGACTNIWWYHSGVSSRRLGTRPNTGRGNFIESIDGIMDIAGNCDAVLMHIGVNDTSEIDANGNYQNLTNVIAMILRDAPNTKVIVSTILSIKNIHGETKNNNWVVPFNERIRQFAAEGFFGDGRVSFVDLYSMVDPDVTGNFSSDNLHPDWCGHDYKSDGWFDAVTNLFRNVGATTVQADGSPLASASGNPELPTAAELGAAARPELADYTRGMVRARTIEIDDSQHFAVGTPAYDEVNGRIAEDSMPNAKNFGYHKVGYFMELVRRDNHCHRWVWVDFDAGERTLAELTLPTNYSDCRTVTKLHVKSNHHAINDVPVSDNSVSGKINFTRFNYGGGSGSKIANYDWQNVPGESGGYGAMQIFRLSPPGPRNNWGEVLFAWNRWGAEVSGAAEIGIGNYDQMFGGIWYGTKTSIEYTDTNSLPMLNDSAYAIKRLEIWVGANNHSLRMLVN